MTYERIDTNEILNAPEILEWKATYGKDITKLLEDALDIARSFESDLELNLKGTPKKDCDYQQVIKYLKNGKCQVTIIAKEN